MKLYTIEGQFFCGIMQYRFRSLFNQTVGAWTTEKQANKNGEAHQNIILKLFNKKIEDFNVEHNKVTNENI